MKTLLELFVVIAVSLGLFSACFFVVGGIVNDPQRLWAQAKEKICWEKIGDFEVSKYGVRCTKNGEIIFNETFRPKETTK